MLEGPVDLEAMAAKSAGRQPQAPSSLALMPVLDEPRPQPRGIPQHTILASPDRLREASQWVTMKNFHPAQTHIMIDRYYQTQALAPGETKCFEMTVSDIESHREKTQADRGYYSSGHLVGQPLPMHPVRFVDVEPLPSARQDNGPDAATAAAAAVAAARATAPASRGRG
jgi:hypothetical protein